MDKTSMTAAGAGFSDEILSDEMAAILRNKTPAQRLAMAFDMWRFAWGMVERITRRQRPEWSEEEIVRHVAARMSHGRV